MDKWFSYRSVWFSWFSGRVGIRYDCFHSKHVILNIGLLVLLIEVVLVDLHRHVLLHFLLGERGELEHAVHELVRLLNLLDEPGDLVLLLAVNLLQPRMKAGIATSWGTLGQPPSAWCTLALLKVTGWELQSPVNTVGVNWVLLPSWLHYLSTGLYDVNIIFLNVLTYPSFLFGNNLCPLRGLTPSLCIPHSHHRNVQLWISVLDRYPHYIHNIDTSTL